MLTETDAHATMSLETAVEALQDCSSFVQPYHPYGLPEQNPPLVGVLVTPCGVCRVVHGRIGWAHLHNYEKHCHELGCFY